jgi:hypothetical protein
MQQLPLRFQPTVDDVVRERLKAENLLASLDGVLARKGLMLARAVKDSAELETLTRCRRNLAPQQKEPQVKVDVTQQQAQGIALTPREAMAEIIRQAQAADKKAVQ